MNEISNMYQKFCNDTKSSYYLNILAILILLSFVVGRKSSIVSNIAKGMIIVIFIIVIYLNISSSQVFFQWNNIGNVLLNPSLVELRNNLLLNIVYCLLILVFIAYLLVDIIY